MQFISQSNLFRLLDTLKADYQVYVPVKKEEQRFYKQYTAYSDDIVIGEVRPFEPLKAFFNRARQTVAEGFSADIPHATARPVCIVGAKACDLKGFKVCDYVFQNHDYQDPFYLKARRENLIISADCTGSLKTCFCLALGLQPYPQEDFDINLAQLEDGFLVELGTPKGRKLVDNYSALFKEVKEELGFRRQEQRQKVIRQVEKNLKENEVPHQGLYKGMIEKKYSSPLWEEEAQTCVECGACNTICPTCHCFLLYDQKSRERMRRLRIWDSCMIKDFARVAGGTNPRGRLWMRLRNRFEKKFDFFPKVAGIYACTGCGRCVLACPAKIDIRKILKKLTSVASEASNG